jgi:hypothetical protein
MRYMWPVVLLCLTGCTGIKYVTTDHGHLVTDQHKPVTIIGNPPLACHLAGFANVYTGYFMYQDALGGVFLDDYGRGTIELQGDVVCSFLDDTR